VNVVALKGDGGKAGEDVEDGFTFRGGAAVFGTARQQGELKETQNAARHYVALIRIGLGFDEALHGKLL
jgi:hypothetical protein